MPRQARIISGILGFLFLSIVIPHTASAGPISYSYNGSITSMRYAECTSYKDSGSCSHWDNTDLASSTAYKDTLFSIGDQFSGSYTYNTATEMILSEDGYQGTYLSALSGTDFEIGNFSEPRAGFLHESSSASIVDGRSGHDLFSTKKNYLFADWFVTIGTTLIDNTGSVFSDLELPESLSLDDFSSYRKMSLVFLRRSDGDQLRLEGLITDLSSSNPTYAVAEPSSLMLLSVSMLGLASTRYRRRRKVA